ncbi:MAG TPA: hypothetical protein EYG86_03460 [Crocinitomicaceae bacterium]|nr:hypothetical protein [Crocinitomicaceae bacterium]
MSEIEEPKKKGNGAFVGIIILLLLGLAVMAYFLSAKNKELNKCQNESGMLQADMDGMNKMMSGYVGTMTNDMKTDFSAILETIDALKEEGSINQDSLNVRQQRIEELQEQVKRGKMSAYQLFKARKEIETMKSIMRGYIVQIDSLNTLNLSLTNNLDSTRSVLVNTQGERDNFRDQVEDLDAQVKKGSKLQAYSFRSVGQKQKMNNSMTETTRARNTVQIKSSFTISENPIASAGKKTVYLQITDPDGKVLQASSGNVVDTENGPVAFSDYKDIDYQNQRIDLAIFFKTNGQTLSKGNYKVKVFCQGQLIGSDSFTLK